MHRAQLWWLAGVLLPATLTAQDLERRASAVASGTVHLSFAARPGVCGDGMNNISTRRDDEEWESDCENGPVRVALRIRDHQVVALRTFVGGRWRQPSPAIDLGTVRPQEAATYFMELAKSRREIGGDPVLPATLADSVTVWPSLLRLARDSGLPSDRRRNAVFWLGQAAEAAAGLALDSVVSDPYGDREVRKQAVFALSQRNPAESIPRLIHIVKTNQDPELRKTALFWLGQSEDPRALELFEQILQ
jgi:HEAT repeat protein